MMIDVKAVWEELKGTLLLGLVMVAIISIAAENSWFDTLKLAGAVLLFVIIWDTTRVLWRKHRTGRRSA